MLTTHSDIVACARGYIGTRFHHQGRLKKSRSHRGGIDCLGLLVGVARELNLRGKNGLPLVLFDERDYPHQPDTEALRMRLGALLYPIPPSELRAGDIVLLDIDGSPQHLAITSDTGIIHAYAPAKAVVEHALDDYWREKIIATYRITNH